MTMNSPALHRLLRLAIPLLAAPLVAPAQSVLFRELEEGARRIDPGAAGPIVIADLNGDGAAELLFPHGIQWNDGHGTFRTAPAPSPLFTCLTAAVVADFDRDGDLDLLGSDCVTGLFLAMNDGLGNFWLATAPLPAIVAPFGLSRLTTLDLNGDGFPDVVGDAPGSPAELFALVNLGGAGFAAVPFPPAARPLDVLGAGDFDANGQDDVVVLDWPSSPAGGFVLRLATFNGSTFSLGAPVATTPAGVIFAGVGDWNGDGYADLVTSNALPAPPGGAVDTLMNGGPGGLQPPSATTPRAAAAYAIVPFQRTTGPTPDAIRFATQQDEVVAVGGGSATTVIAPLPAPVLLGLANPVADLDGDGDQDVLGMSSAGTPRPLFNDAGSLVDPHGAFRGAFAQANRHAFVIDVEGDGDFDLVSSNLRQVEINDGMGRFTLATATVSPSLIPLDGPNGCSGDFNGDGREDLFIAASATYGYHHVVLNLPGLIWSDRPAASPGIVTRKAVAGDLDLDGDQDVVAVGAAGPYQLPPLPLAARLEILRNAGNGLMTRELIDTAHNATDVALADLDADGDLDIVQANRALSGNPPDLSLLWVNNGGVFVATALPFALEADRVAAGDLDHDGIIDLVFDGVAWLHHGTTWTAAPQVAAPPIGGFTWHQVADLDGDSLPELLTDLGWYPGLGVAGFGPFHPWPTGMDFVGQAMRSVIGVHDLDGDGDADVVLRLPMVLWNVTRHLAHGALVRPGRPAALEIYGSPGAAYQLVVASGPATPPLAVPPFGTVFIDPPTAVILPAATLDATGFGTLTATCPNNPALVGLSFWWQAVMLNELRLTGVEESRVFGF